MIAAHFVHSVKARKLIVLLSIILIWQFTFPQTLSAQTETDLNPLNLWNAQTENVENTPPNTPSFPKIADKPEPNIKETLYINVTAYSSTPDQTQGDISVCTRDSSANGIASEGWRYRDFYFQRRIYFRRKDYCPWLSRPCRTH